jgi:hypothetical protein
LILKAKLIAPLHTASIFRYTFNNNNIRRKEVFVESNSLQAVTKENIWLQRIAVIFPAGVTAANRELHAFDIDQQL